MDIVKLNYQFINTIAFQGDELKELIINHYEEARDMRVDPDKARKALLRREDLFDNDRSDKYDDDDGDEEGLDLPTWKYAIYRNKYFMHDAFIQEKLTDLSNGMKRNVLLGRIDVTGSCSHDKSLKRCKSH